MKKIFIVSACVMLSVAAIAQTFSPVLKNYSKMKKVNYLDSKSAYKGSPLKGVDDDSQLIIGSSVNLFSVLLPQQNCLSVNPETGVVAMFYRSNSTEFAGNNIMASFSKNGGYVWDTITVYNCDVDPLETRPARYPQGVVYNPEGNTNPDNVYIASMGPVLASDWTGSFFSSIKLDGTNADTKVTLFANEADDVEGFDVEFPRTYGQVRGDKVFAYSEASETDDDDYYIKHHSIINVGTFGSEGNITWRRFLHNPDFIINSDGRSKGFPYPGLAMESDSVGYLAYIGFDSTSIDSITFKPIVYKTEDACETWTKIPFEWNTIQSIKSYCDSMSPVQRPFYTTVKDAVVDGEGHLHIISLVQPAATNHPDSLDFSMTWTYIGGYVFDTYMTEDGWDAICVDTIWTKEISNESGNTDIIGADGNDPEWNDRMQISMSADGMKLFYVWMDSDPNLSENNSAPNIFVRMFDVETKTLADHVNITLDTPYDGVNYWMYAADYATNNNSDNYTLHIVTSSKTATDDDPVYHQYFRGTVINGADGQMVTGVEDLNVEDFVSMYPNPTSDNVKISFGQNENGKYNVEIINTLGSVVMNKSFDVNEGSHVSVNTENLPNGIYFVKIGNNSKSITKKLIKN